MKRRIILILFLFILLCSCAEINNPSTLANSANLSEPSTLEEPSNSQLSETYADVRGIDVAKALASDELSTEESGDCETYYGTDPWLNDPDNPESQKWRHSFMTTAFLKNGYNIRLAWNNPSSLYETTRQVTAEQEYTVSFIEETESFADDPQVLEAIRLCILERKQEETNEDGKISEDFILINPVVVDVDGP